MFDSLIQNVLHAWVPRIGQDASIAQRSRTEFAPSLKPSDD
jgi:hypothetical protein